MTNHPLDDVADHERSVSPSPSFSSIMCDPRAVAAINQVIDECSRATSRYGPMRSAHEGFAILLEEVDELWDEVKKNDKTRSHAKMMTEAKQVAAMALRFLVDITPLELTQEHRDAGPIQPFWAQLAEERRKTKVLRRVHPLRRTATVGLSLPLKGKRVLVLSPAGHSVHSERSVIYQGPERRERAGGRRRCGDRRKKS
jgi:hypothetical protein